MVEKDATVEVAREKTININNSVYLLMPKQIRNKLGIAAGDEFTYHQVPGSRDIILRKVEG